MIESPTLLSSHLPQTDSNRVRQLRYFGPVIFGLYAVLVALAIGCHEPWADEAQAWLLARDAPFVELWTRLLHYEGSPGLWHTLLVLLNKAGLPYRSEGILSGLLGSSAVWLLLTRSPFPKTLQAFLPFTYFLSYQYVAVARSYSLIPVLLFICLITYKHFDKHLYLFTVFLALLACVSVHGVALSGSLWVLSQLKLSRMWRNLGASERRCAVMSAVGYVLVVILLAYLIWPANDIDFPVRHQVSADRLFTSAEMFLTEGFTGNLYLTVFLLALSAPFLYAGGGLPLFLIFVAFYHHFWRCRVRPSLAFRDSFYWLAWCHVVFYDKYETHPSCVYFLVRRDP